MSLSHNQNSNGSTNVPFKAIYSWKKQKTKKTLFDSANHVYSVLFTSHNKVWILSKSNYSSLSSPYQLLIGRVLWNRMTRLVLAWKAFQMCTKKKNKKKKVSTASTENQVICSTDTAVIQKREVAVSVYWFRYFYANFSRTFLYQSSYSICPWICCDSVVPAGEWLHRRSSWLSHSASYWFLFLFGIQVNSDICNSCLYSIWGAIPILFILVRYLQSFTSLELHHIGLARCILRGN